MHSALYTKHKTQKNKRWQDGRVEVSVSGMLTLRSESGEVMEAGFPLGRGGAVHDGDELTLSGFLVQVEGPLDEDAAGAAAGAAAAAQETRAPLSHSAAAAAKPLARVMGVARRGLGAAAASRGGLGAGVSGLAGAAAGERRVFYGRVPEARPAASRRDRALPAKHAEWFEQEAERIRAEEGGEKAGGSGRPSSAGGRWDAFVREKRAGGAAVADEGDDEEGPPAPGPLPSSLPVSSHVPQRPPREPWAASSSHLESSPAAPSRGPSARDVLFPSAEGFMRAQEESAFPRRRVELPDAYPSKEAYVAGMRAAVEEEVVLQVWEAAARFYRDLAAVGERDRSAGQVETLLRRAGHGYHAGMRYFGKHAPRNGGNKKGYARTGGQKRRRPPGAGDEEKDEEGEEEDEKEEDEEGGKYFVQLDSREASSRYSQGDLWVLCSDPGFSEEGGQGGTTAGVWYGQGVAGQRGGFNLFVVRSTYHGPTQDGVLGVEFVGSCCGGGNPWESPSMRGKVSCTGLRVGSLTGEFAMLKTLEGLHGLSGDRAFPLLPAIMRGRVPAPVGALVKAARAREAATLSEGVVSAFDLNVDQAAVVRGCARWFTGAYSDGTGGVDPVVLLHGSFGSGKTHTLVAAISMVLEATGGKGRVLVAAHTNVAVDNVLTGLQGAGRSDFLRVGCVRKIAKAVLPHSLSSSGGSGAEKDVLRDLKAMLREPGGVSGPRERRAVEEEIARVQAGMLRARARRLASVPVVGATCAACAPGGRLDGQHFDVVVLDESSQVPEALSLLALARFSARFLLAAGDPAQLPPTLASGPARQSHAAMDRADARGLGKTLFTRLAARSDLEGTDADADGSGTARLPVMLRTQYRCHPAIGALPSQLFYGGQLIHGTSEQDRPALVAGLPPLSFFPTRGAEQASAGSVCNAAEADRVAAIVQALVTGPKACAHPSGSGELGRAVTVAVITPYRAQVRAVTSSLRRRGLISGGASAEGGGEGDEPIAEGCLQVATVDSFQGAERDVVIVSTVKTHGSASFIDEARRLNVTLSRPRSHLILVGSPEALTGGLSGLTHLPRVVHACTPMTLDALASLTGAGAGCKGAVSAVDARAAVESEPLATGYATEDFDGNHVGPTSVPLADVANVTPAAAPGPFKRPITPAAPE